MKILKQTTLKNGKVKLTVEVDPNENVVAVDALGYYISGYPLEEVVYGSTILALKRVTWCEVEQRWIS